MSDTKPKPRFAAEDEDAEERYLLWHKKDPYPTIPPALLNRADITNYVATTGMIVPFDEGTLKPASYGVRLGGKCVYWDSNGKKHVVVLSDKRIAAYNELTHVTELKLERNSIAFVSLEPTFRLPHYIALRFNLKIQHVYRGLLLGTGPLVDPGFVSKLSFPLHNLTNAEYTLRAGEVFIYLEFTKISERLDWYPDGREKDFEERRGLFAPLESRKLERKDVDDYLHHANQGRPIQSSIPIAVRTAQNEAAKAKENSDFSAQSARSSRDNVESLKRRLTSFSLFGLVFSILVIGLAGYQLWIGINQLALQGANSTKELRVEFEALKSKVDRDLPGVKVKDILSLEAELEFLKNEVDKIKSNSVRKDHLKPRQ